MRTTVILCGCLAALHLIAGCSKSEERIPTHPVFGRVLYDGRPAVGVQVTLIPTDAPMVPQIPRNPHGLTDDEGRFTLSTFDEGDGAAEGGYQVVLLWPSPADPEREGLEEEETDRLFGWYDPAHSTISVRIKPGVNELPQWNLPKLTSPPPPSEGIPGRN